MGKLCRTLILASLLHIAFLPLLASAECGSESYAGSRGGSAVDRARTLKYKLAAVVSILLAGILGISLPILGGKIPSLRPESNFFFLVKAFAAGVILATGFVHILPEAEENLTSSCLGDEPPWGDFPLTGLIAMVSAILTMMIDSFASGYFKRSHLDKDVLPVRSGGGPEDLQNNGHEGHVHVHTHSTHGHSHGSAFISEQDDNIRHKIVSQVLELGILVHSVIIGLSLGTSESLDTIKPLTAALTFHQLFEGLGLGGCISQARFKTRAVVVMVIFFSLTTPVGIGVGIGVSETYDEDSPTTLIVSGLLGAMAAGILIYMALVDLLAADFMNPKIQSNLKMLSGCSVSLLLGAGCMSLLAIWA